MYSPLATSLKEDMLWKEKKNLKLDQCSEKQLFRQSVKM